MAIDMIAAIMIMERITYDIILITLNLTLEGTLRFLLPDLLLNWRNEIVVICESEKWWLLWGESVLTSLNDWLAGYYYYWSNSNLLLIGLFTPITNYSNSGRNSYINCGGCQKSKDISVRGEDIPEE